MNTRTVSRKTSFAALTTTVFGSRREPERSEAIASEAALDIDRFMGDWHVIATLPGDREKDAYRPMLRYGLNNKGTIDARFAFRKGDFDGPPATVESRGLIPDRSSMTWRKPFYWPFTSAHRVLFVNEDYTQAIISRDAENVWIISRDAELSCADFFECAQRVRERGFDTRKLAFMPQTRGAQTS